MLALMVGAALVSSAGTPGDAAALGAQCCDAHGSISLINPRTNRVIATIHVPGTPTDLAVSRADGAAFLTVIGTNRARPTRIFKITPGERVTARPLAVGFDPVNWVLAPAGRYLYLARAFRLGQGGRLIPASIVPVKAANGKAGRPIPIPSSAPFPGGGPMAVSPNGRVLYYASLGPNAVVPVNLSTRRVGRAIRVRPASFQSAQMLFSRDGRRLYLLGYSGSRSSLTEVNLRTGRVAGWVSIHGFPEDMAITPDGREVYATTYPNTVTEVRTSRPAVVKRITVGDAAAVAIAPDGRTAYVTGSDYLTTGTGQLTAISTRTNTAAPPITVGPDGAEDLSISPSGRWAYIFDSDDSVIPVNLTTRLAGTPIRVAPQPPEGGLSNGGGVSFTADGKILYVIDLTT